MDDIDKIFKSHISNKIRQESGQEILLCPDEATMANYICANMAADEKNAIENHMANCQTCLVRLKDAYKAQSLYKEGKLPCVPESLLQKSKAIAKTKRRTSPKGIRKNLWLIATCVAFVLSFVFPKYFMQCLVITVLFGIKWIVESENVRTLILVLDSWRRHSHEGDEEITRRLSDRHKSDILKR